MKNVLKYFIIALIFITLGALITYNLLNNKINLSKVYDSSVYIEAIDGNNGSGGSGFAYKVENNKAYIITCYHVIEGYNNIYVYNLDNEKVKANLFKYDEYTDIAILEIDNTLSLKSIKIGNSDNISVGDNIYVLGTPINRDYMSTLTNGIISFVNRKITFDTTHGTTNLEAIQIDASVNYGNSGGLLLNNIGEAIGMIFLRDSDLNNIAFAMPINFVMDIVKKLENNELNRPNLGAIMTNTTNINLILEYGLEESKIDGVILLTIDNNSILYNAGLKNGDVIIKFDNKDISNVNELREELYKKRVGDNVVIEYYRDDIYYKVNVKL